MTITAHTPSVSLAASAPLRSKTKILSTPTIGAISSIMSSSACIVHCAGLRKKGFSDMPRLHARNTKGIGWSRCLAQKQSYPLREELVTILSSEWPLLRNESSDVLMVGSYFVVDSLNHQLERVVGVIQDALVGVR